VVEGGVVVRSEVKGLSEWSVVKNKLVQVVGSLMGSGGGGATAAG